MSIFSKILGAIFPSSHPTTDANPVSPPAQSTAGTGVSTGPGVGGTATAAGGAAASSMSQVDVEAVLSAKAKQNPEKLNWQTSIVDLMKLLGLDSSLANRKELAHELGYTGDTNDSATMNIWLQKQVMKKLAENGGKVPASLMA